MAKTQAFTLGHLAFIAAQFNGNQSQTAETLGIHRDSVSKAVKAQR
jgi:DNA-binding protein Fis